MKYTSEIPAGANEFVHQVDEKTGAIVTSTEPEVPINRYRFYWDSPTLSGTEDAEIVELLCRVLPCLGQEPRWLLCWPKNGPSNARSRWIHARRIREGWKIVDGGSIFMATKSVGSIRRAPEGYLWQDGGFVLLVNGCGQESTLVAGETLPTLEDLAASRFLRPGLRFMEFLAACATSCVYFDRDDLGRDEVIVLTENRLRIPL